METRCALKHEGEQTEGVDTMWVVTEYILGLIIVGVFVAVIEYILGLLGIEVFVGVFVAVVEYRDGEITKDGPTPTIELFDAGLPPCIGPQCIEIDLPLHKQDGTQG